MKRRLVMAVMLPVVFATACAADRKPAHTPKVSAPQAGAAFVESGFLTTDYARLAPVAPGSARRTYVNPDKKLSSYGGIFLDRITIWRGESHKELVESADFQKVVDDLYAVTSAELRKTFNLVPKAGPGVGRLRIAMVAIDSPDERLDVYVSEGEPSAAGSDAALPQGVREFGRKAWVEAEMLDGVTKEPIFAVVDRVADVVPHAVPIKTWQDLHEALDAWAKQGVGRIAALEKQK